MKTLKINTLRILAVLAVVISFSTAINHLTNNVTKATSVIVTNNLDSGAGSLRQAILDVNSSCAPVNNFITFNINPITANSVVGADVIYSIDILTPLPVITCSNLTIDGSTYNNNGFNISSTAVVGVDNNTFNPVRRPNVEIRDAGNLDNGLEITNTSNVLIDNIAILGFGKAYYTPPTNYKTANIEVNTSTDFKITNSIIGCSAINQNQPNIGALSLGNGLHFNGSTNFNVTNNLVCHNKINGIEVNTLMITAPVATNSIITNNQIFGNGGNESDPIGDGIWVHGSFGNEITNNHIYNNASTGIDGLIDSNLDNNTIINNGINNAPPAATQDHGVVVRGSNSVISKNIIASNVGNGISVLPNTIFTNLVLPTNNNVITANSIYGNGEIGIDLFEETNSNYDGSQVTVNDVSDIDIGGNSTTNFPVLTNLVELCNDGFYTLSGVAPLQSTIEIFISDNDPTGFGEGKTLIYTLTEDGVLDQSNATISYTSPVTGLNVGADTAYEFVITIPTATIGNNSITATATTANGTSEFSNNITPQTACIGLSKDVVVSTDNPATVKYLVTLDNLSSIDLNISDISDNLVNTFLNQAAILSTTLTSTDLIVNPLYNGNTDTNMISGVQSIIANSSKSITLTVNLDNSLIDETIYMNTASTNVSAPNSTISLYDESQDGTSSDPDNNGSGIDNNDPTPVNFTETIIDPAVIGLAKDLTTITETATGYTIGFDLLITNYSTQTISSLSLVDDLVTTFGTSNIVVNSISSNNSSVIVNPNYSGTTDTELLDISSLLTAGQSALVSIEFDLNEVLATSFLNQATTTGIDENDNTVTDLSTDGGNPDTNEDDDPTNDSTPTPIEIIIPSLDAEIGLAKVVSSVISNLDGSYSVTYTMLIENTGNADLSNITLVDDLSTTFSSSISYNVSSITSTDLIVNTAYNGFSDIDLLATGNSLAIGESATVDITVNISDNQTGILYLNTATTTGETTDSDIVTDISTDGIDVYGGQLTPGDSSDPTPLILFVDLELTKTASIQTIDNVDVLTYEISVTNIGNIYGTGITIAEYIPTELTITNFGMTEGSYDELTNMWSIGDGLNPGENATLTITAELPIVEGLELENIAEVYSLDQYDIDSTPNNLIDTEDDQDSAMTIGGVVITPTPTALPTITPTTIPAVAPTVTPQVLGSSITTIPSTGFADYQTMLSLMLISLVGSSLMYSIFLKKD